MKQSFSYIIVLLGLMFCLSSCHTSAPRLDYKALAQASVRLGMDIELTDNHKSYVNAAEWIGTPYRAGGDSRHGTDCSGLVSQLYKKTYRMRLSRSTDGQLKESNKITRRNLREGDLVFFTSRSSRKKVAHVGIYLKDGKFIHASTSQGVIVSSLKEKYYTQHWLCGGKRHMNYTTYLFDFDYTLADSSRGIVTCFRNVLNRHGYTHPTDDDIKRTIGKTLEDSFSILSGVTDPQQLAEFKKEYVKEADTHMTVNTVLFLETKSVLMALKDSGARIGIISTKFRYRIKELLNQHFPDDFLDIIIGGEDVKTPKPSPEGLLLAIKQLHATKAETLYIGDSTVDAETAQKAGVDFAGITHGMTTAEELRQYPHKKIMSSLEELLEREPLPAASPKNIGVRRIVLLLVLFAAFAALICFLTLV